MSSNCQAYLFSDYWEDIGTIKSFFDANLALTEQVGVTLVKWPFDSEYGNKVAIWNLR